MFLLYFIIRIKKIVFTNYFYISKIHINLIFVSELINNNQLWICFNNGFSKMYTKKILVLKTQLNVLFIYNLNLINIAININFSKNNKIWYCYINYIKLKALKNYNKNQ